MYFKNQCKTLIKIKFYINNSYLYHIILFQDNDLEMK